MTRSLSQKFRFFTFLCIALLAYVHGYNLQETSLAPYSSVKEPLTFTTFFEYLFANGLLRFRIPMLFMISGYLYALYDHRPYQQQISSRFRSLIIPYLLWSAFGLLLTFALQQLPYTLRLLQEARLDQLGDNRPYAEIGLKGIIERWLFAPISYQLWFIFVLFIYNVCYPAIRWLVIKVPYIWLPLTFFAFFFLIYVPVIDTRGLFFFSFGVWLQKRNFNIEKEPSWFSLGHSLILFAGLCIIKTFMAFELEADTAATQIALAVLHQVSVIVGIMAMWFGADKVIQWFMKKQWFSNASGYSFFIFGMHVPLLPYVMYWAQTSLHFLPYHRLLLYIMVPLLVLFFCIRTGAMLRHFVPRVYAVLTGGRGF